MTSLKKNYVEVRVFVPVLDEDIPLGVIIINDAINYG